MTRSWGPSAIGKALTGSVPWQLSLETFELTVTINGKTATTSITASEGLQVVPGLVWSAIHFPLAPGRSIKLDGIPNAEAGLLAHALATARVTHQHQLKIEKLISAFDQCVAPLVAWGQGLAQAAESHLATKGWITREFAETWTRSKPTTEFEEALADPDLRAHIEAQSPNVRDGLRLWQSDLPAHVRGLNEQHLTSELVACKTFFDEVEKSPLTDEQARAVVCFDNRVQVIAAAGSGKTSTMVAKAGYALHRRLIAADRILLLAFNAEAARELQQRVLDRLLPLGLPAKQIVARTFHGFGLDVVGGATGKKPSLAPWLENGGDLHMLMTIVDGLKDSSAAFRANWDLFRVVLARDLPEFGHENEAPEDWDRNTKATGFRTLGGEIVKSQGERVIADWLFFNGVEYRYEQPYAFDTADATHRQYRPDFYYPQIDVYHEHWALNAKGQPPAAFSGYLDGVRWKRELHQRQGTVLLETTSADVRSGEAFQYLATELTRRGIVLKPNPDRPCEGRRHIEHDDLVRTFRAFLTHAKGNRLSNEELRGRLEAAPGENFRFRHEVFLNLFFAVRATWEAKLAGEGVIDFEDMLNLATDHLEAGWSNPFELVMVDEFQDASRARARLTRALVSRPGRHLFAVGDDWQSINRFAGADLSVMTEFEKWFGKSETLRLERTFRCPQSLCDVSSAFVSRNPQQLRKTVRSSALEYSKTLHAIQVTDDTRIKAAIREYLVLLHTGVESGEVPAGANGVASVLVLGRYRSDGDYVPRWEDLSARIQVKYLTVHGSKGLEADYVVLPRMASGTYGFPSTMADDPVLQLAMPDAEDFSMAEERRLFYVALTRARRSVLLVMLRDRPSSFALELIKEHGLEPRTVGGEAAHVHLCTRCGTGSMVARNGPYGTFLACNNFPRCKHTVSLKSRNR